MGKRTSYDALDVAVTLLKRREGIDKTMKLARYALILAVSEAETRARRDDSALASTSTADQSVLRKDWKMSLTSCTWSHASLRYPSSTRHSLIERHGVTASSKSSCDAPTSRASCSRALI